MRVARMIVGLVAVAAVAAGPAGSVLTRDALIRPGVGVGKLRLGMRLAAVEGALGKPTAVVKGRSLGFGSEYVEYSWGASPDWRVGVLGRRGDRVVVMAATTLRRERTRSGVGVGSTYAAVHRRLGAFCRRNTKPGDLAWSANAVCFVGGRGRTQTVFSFFGTCNLPPRTVIVCPTTRRTYTAYQVVVGTADGLELSGERP